MKQLFYAIQDKQFSHEVKKFQLPKGEKTRNRHFIMSISEVMAIKVLFHISGFKNFKHFYLLYVKQHLKDEFPKTVSYDHFVELTQSALLPLALYLNT